LRDELWELNAAGLSAWEVLMIATRNAAAYFGEEGAWGVVASQATADLQLLDGNPVESLAALDRRLGVMVHGRWYPRQELDGKLAALAAAGRNTPQPR
jgi:imidazolonepropionase-like amidohydrolase